jgi:hypothetical protein
VWYIPEAEAGRSLEHRSSALAKQHSDTPSLKNKSTNENTTCTN